MDPIQEARKWCLNPSLVRTALMQVLNFKHILNSNGLEVQYLLKAKQVLMYFPDSEHMNVCVFRQGI